MTGTVEFVYCLTFGPRRGQFIYGIALAQNGQRVFVHASRCDGQCPALYDRIEFDVDEHLDPRGPVATNVRIIGLHPQTTDQELADLEVVCSECRETFVWSAGEQQFYHHRRFLPPKKCRTCRPLVRERLGLPVRGPRFEGVFDIREENRNAR